MTNGMKVALIILLLVGIQMITAGIVYRISKAGRKKKIKEIMEGAKGQSEKKI